MKKPYFVVFLERSTRYPDIFTYLAQLFHKYHRLTKNTINLHAACRSSVFSCVYKKFNNSHLKVLTSSHISTAKTLPIVFAASICAGVVTWV